MESSGLDAIQEQLQKERVAVKAKADSTRERLSHLEFELSRIDAALAALSGTPRPGASPRPTKAKERAKANTPSPKKSDVVAAICSTLAEQGILEEASLRSQVEKHLVAGGFSRLGLAMRFKEALADRRFVDTPGGIRLQEEEPTKVKVPASVS